MLEGRVARLPLHGLYGVWLALASLSLGCADDDDGDAGTLADSGPRDDEGVVSGERFATAAATLVSVDSNDPMAVMGAGQFRATQRGVDIELSLSGCSDQSPAPVEILEASDCSPASLQAPVWNNGLGAGIPPIDCRGAVSGFGSLRYERRARRSDSWTIGGEAGTDVVGRVLIVRNSQDGRPRLCGVIERTQDVVRTPLPPPDEPPSATTRAQLSGLCFAKQFPANAAAGCPDIHALTQCSSAHCDVGGCIKACSEYTRCIDASDDPCLAGSLCPHSDACAQCQNELLSCTLGYCAQDLSCVPPTTPDGPCGEVLACCALQGEDASRCLSVFPSYFSGGDASCIGAINDREAVGHLKSPCRFEEFVVTDSTDAAGAATRATDRELTSERLEDDVAGIPCIRDADCPGGMCAAAPEGAGVASSEGFCTRACTTMSQCGLGGVCISSGNGDGRCLASCGSQGECRAGFVCGGAVRLPVFGTPGACLPMRPPGMLADGVAGRSCSDDADCPGGQCATRNLLGTDYPDNYCTARCYADGQCGAGGVCLLPLGSIDPGYCLLACETHEDCEREGYRCRAMNDGTRLFHACYPGADPLPDHSVGLPCEDQSACGAQHAQCAKEMPYGSFSDAEIAPAPGGYCTQRCALDEECGAGAECVNTGTHGGLCMASCTDTAPCRDGYTCLAHLRDGPDAKVCVPRPAGDAP